MATTPDPPVAEVAVMVILTYAAAVAVILAYPPARKWVEKFWRDLKAILTFFGAPEPYTEPAKPVQQPGCAHKYTPVHSSDGAEILAYLCIRCGHSHYAEPEDSRNENEVTIRDVADSMTAWWEQREAAAQRAWNTAQQRHLRKQREAAERAWDEYLRDKAAREAEKASDAAERPKWTDPQWEDT